MFLIDDIVRVSNPKLTTHNQTGRVVNVCGHSGCVRVAMHDENCCRSYKPSNLEIVPKKREDSAIARPKPVVLGLYVITAPDYEIPPEGKDRTEFLNNAFRSVDEAVMAYSPEHALKCMDSFISDVIDDTEYLYLVHPDGSVSEIRKAGYVACPV